MSTYITILIISSHLHLNGFLNHASFADNAWKEREGRREEVRGICASESFVYELTLDELSKKKIYI